MIKMKTMIHKTQYVLGLENTNGVNRGMPDKYNDQTKNDKKINNDIYKTLYRQLKIEQNRGWAQVLRKGRPFLLNLWLPS